MKKRVGLLSIAAGAGLLLGACGDNGGEGNDQTGTDNGAGNAENTEEMNAGNEEAPENDAGEENAEANEGNGGEAADGGDFTIALAMNTLDNPFFVDLNDGAVETAEEEGMEIITSDSQGDAAQQASDVENLLIQDPDVLILNPVDSDAAQQIVMMANDEDIPVLTVDRQASGGEVVSHVGFDALRSGNIAGEFVTDTLEEEGNVVELQGILGTNVGRDRSEGFNEHVSEFDGIEIIASQSANFDRGEALTVMEDILQANDSIDAVYAANDEMAMGALSAIEGAGRLDEMILIGTDAIDPAMEAIREGRMEATIAEPPYFLGRDVVHAAIDHLNGEEVEEMITLENQLVTEENVDEIETR
ncbi:substrate-binding domain-containing protein [Alkalicoccus urumqiensis]|uniref:D-ribose ABC transporter substrate-binding protein n=1 Tax=Alkalicoccus urumqiensis TaxID=1548213 RepID=A0A2P6ML83_ALKUR|nr:substrate-binding domain-containing protein [Alkalicoccus urumqiensis]PRO67040.1 D-ribose ABC transporter substrate-binding protein [Alkalicoccus urumqiensis]